MKQPVALLAWGLFCIFPAHALDISGSSTIQPVVEKLIPLYTAQGGEAVKLTGGGSGAGIKNTQSGASQIGMASRSLKDEEKATLKHATIGIDALAIAVNKSNPIDKLSKAQLIDLYTGKIDNWQAVGGPDRPVVRVSKEVGRSTLELFEHYTGLVSPDREKNDGKPLISRQSYIIGANLEAATLAGGMSGAVAYLSVGTALALAQAGMPIKVVALEGVMPSEQTVYNKTYAIVRELNLAYANETPDVAKFIVLALSPQGQQVVKAMSFLPVAKP
jgi:phosphate transport system substrate-binding protein